MNWNLIIIVEILICVEGASLTASIFAMSPYFNFHETFHEGLKSRLVGFAFDGIFIHQGYDTLSQNFLIDNVSTKSH